jgi:hypothetical protein
MPSRSDQTAAIIARYVEAYRSYHGADRLPIVTHHSGSWWRVKVHHQVGDGDKYQVGSIKQMAERLEARSEARRCYQLEVAEPDAETASPPIPR